ncbi:MAG: hypothetical protein P8Z50_04455 [candidate division WOR-3 bacterium]
MDKQLLLLISLQELDILRKDRIKEEEVGFEIDNIWKCRSPCCEQHMSGLLFTLTHTDDISRSGKQISNYLS